MADEKYISQAKKVFDDFCQMLDTMDGKYKADENEMRIDYGVEGYDIPMDFVVIIDAKARFIKVYSLLPFTAPEDKRIDLAIAACHATSSILDGSFDFDIESGRVVFRLTHSFEDTDINEAMLRYIFSYSSFAVDLFNDKLLAVSKGNLDIGDFLSE